MSIRSIVAPILVAVGTLVAAGPLVGCGQKGPLYLPKPLPAPPEAEKRSGKDAGDAQKPVDAGSDPQRQPSDRK